jgi:hypothetical protein
MSTPSSACQSIEPSNRNFSMKQENPKYRTRGQVVFLENIQKITNSILWYIQRAVPMTALAKPCPRHMFVLPRPCRILPALSRPRTKWQAGKHYHVGCIIRKFLSCPVPPVVLQISQKPNPSLAMQRTNP